MPPVHRTRRGCAQPGLASSRRSETGRSTSLARKAPRPALSDDDAVKVEQLQSERLTRTSLPGSRVRAGQNADHASSSRGDQSPSPDDVETTSGDFSYETRVATRRGASVSAFAGQCRAPSVLQRLDLEDAVQRLCCIQTLPYCGPWSLLGLWNSPMVTRAAETGCDLALPTTRRSWDSECRPSLRLSWSS